MTTSRTAVSAGLFCRVRARTALLAASAVWLLLAATALADGTDVTQAKALLQKRRAEVGSDHADTLAALAELAKAHCDNGAADKAVPLFEEVLARCKANLGSHDPQTLKAMLNLGQAYIFAGSAAKGCALLEQGVKQCEAVLGPDHATTRKALALVGHARVATGETKTFRFGVKMPKWLAKPLLKSAGLQWMAKAMAGQGDAAIVELTEAIRANPEDAEAYLSRGFVRNIQRQYDGAIADLDAAIRLDPWRADAYAERGNSWANKGDQEKAIADYTTAIRLNPQRSAMRYRNRAWSWSDQGQFDKAIADCNEAIRLEPSNANGYRVRGSAWLRKGGANAKALADFSTAIRLNPKDGRTYCFRGEALVRRGDFANGIADMSKAIRLEPTNAANYLDRSYAWHRQGGADAQELTDLDAAIRLDPQRDYGYIYRGKLHLGHKDYAKAGADFDNADKLKTKDGNAYLFRAILRSQCPDATYRDGRKAIADARKGRQLLQRPGWYGAQVLAAAHAEAGDFEEAARWQEQALADPSFTNYDDGLRRLELYRKQQPYHLK